VPFRALLPIADETNHGCSQVRCAAPAEYTVPPFPSLFWPPQDATVILYELDEMWKFTLFWTLILYGLFHLGAVGVAVLMQGGKRMSSWKYLWLVPLIYALIAGFEALIAGTLVGLMLVPMPRSRAAPGALTVRVQSRCELSRRLLLHVDLDPLCLGLGQRRGSGRVLVQDPGRVVAVGLQSMQNTVLPFRSRRNGGTENSRAGIERAVLLQSARHKARDGRDEPARCISRFARHNGGLRPCRTPVRHVGACVHSSFSARLPPASSKQQNASRLRSSQPSDGPHHLQSTIRFYWPIIGFASPSSIPHNTNNRGAEQSS
jgi:hypothetical protein